MKIFNFNDFINESYDEDDEKYKQSIKDLKNSLSRLKSFLKSSIRNELPKDVYQDYFLEFTENEKFWTPKEFVRHSNGIVTDIHFYKLIDANDAEKLLEKYVGDLKSIKSKLEHFYNFNCHFVIKYNSKIQAILNPETIKNDDYQFTGIGSSDSGRDGDGIWHDKLPEGKVSCEINFFIV